MGKNLDKKLLFVIDEHGRTLTKKSLQKLLSELFDKALGWQNADCVVANSPTFSICAYLADQVAGKDIVDWEMIYLHGSKYPPVLLTHEDKEKLVELLPSFEGTSAEAICRVLAESGVFN